MRFKITQEFLNVLTSKRIYLRPHFHHGNTKDKVVNVLSDVEAESYSRIPETSLSWGGAVSIGAFSYIVQGSSLGRSKIGRYCSIATGVRIMGQSHPTDRVTTSTWTYGNNIKAIIKEDFGITPIQNLSVPNEPGVQIGNDVWIAENVTLKRNIQVNDGAIVAANSVVTKDVPPYAIVAGNPAKVIRFRFSETQIKDLCNLQWWNKSPQILSQFDLSNIKSFLKGANELEKAENFYFEKLNLTKAIKKQTEEK